MIPTRNKDLTPRRPFACPNCRHLVYRAWSHLFGFIASFFLDLGGQLAAMLGSLLYALLLGHALELTLICVAWLVVSRFAGRVLEQRWPLRAEAPGSPATMSG